MSCLSALLELEGMEHRSERARKLRALLAFLGDALLRGRPRRASGILVYDALELTQTLAYTPAGYWNFGLWHPETRDTTEACEALLACAAEWAELEEASLALDVGFGTGAQDLFFANRSGVAIHGVNQSASQAALARERVAAAGLAERVDLRPGEATCLEFPDAHFDVVLCIEAAFHFDTRERFFAEAHRVLRPGGRLVLTDILPAARAHWSHGLFWRLFDRLFFVPRENRVSLETYREQLKACGFDARVEVVTDRVYVPFFEAIGGTYDWRPARFVVQLLVRWFRWRLPCEYVIAIATK